MKGKGQEAYERGYADGLANKPPDVESLALGQNYCNDYEKGYIDSGQEGVGDDRDDQAQR